MMNNLNRFLGVLFVGAALMAFSSSPSHRDCKSDGTHCPYTLAERYFVRNDYKKAGNLTITNKEDFFDIFGEAAVMGDNGRPTSINFNKQYVLAVIKPETSHTTTLKPIGLKRDKKNRLVFTYQCITGGAQTYTIVPCLVIIVDKKVSGNISFKEMKSK